MNPNFSSALEIENLHKTYQTPRGSVTALRGISVSVRAGECVGLLGPNGAGKSTAMNCMTGFYAASKGSVKILGYSVTEHPREARRSLGVCSQEDTLDTDFDVIGQMVRYGTYFGLSVKESKLRSLELLARIGLKDRATSLVESLSGGMRRRLQVGRALINHPKVLILDEPSTGLDPEVRRELWQIIQEYKSAQGAVLLSTHYMEEAQRLCDRVALIHDGHILETDTPERLIQKHCPENLIEEEIRPGVIWKRLPQLEDVYMKLTGRKL